MSEPCLRRLPRIWFPSCPPIFHFLFSILFLALFWARPAFTLDPSLDISQYAHTSWKARDGFVKGEITAIAQTRDGYLWLGTEFGLYRFDGVHAVPWQPPVGEQLPSNYIGALLVARDGTVWIGTLKGLASWRDGKLTSYPEMAGQFAFRLFQDREQRIWVATVGSGRLCAVEAGKVQCYADGSFGRTVDSIYEDRRGNLWVAAWTGVWRWKPGPPENYRLPHAGMRAYGLTEDHVGTLLVATSDGLKQLSDGKIQNYAVPGLPLMSYLLRSDDGSLWLGSPQGLWHLRGKKTDTFGFADGLSGDVVTSIFEDREGTIWVATTGGLDRFREFAVQRISRSQGLSSNDPLSIQATKDGAIWIATSDGLNRWENGRVAVYGKRSATGRNGTQGEQQGSVSAAITQIANSTLSGALSSLGLDDQGRLYASTRDGISYFGGNHFVRVPNAPGGNIWSIAGDSHGKLWVSHGTTGLFYFAPGDAAEPIPWTRFGQKVYGARALVPDPSQGGVWLGFYDGGIAYFKDGNVRAAFTAADGLGHGRVNRMRFGSHGTVWAATEGGLSRFKDGHIETLSSKNGLPCDEVHWSVEDDDHAVWVYMPCGLVRIDRSEWYAWVDDPSHIVKATMFDSSDGVPSVGVYGSSGPHVTKAPDGKIWFAARDGVGVIAPRHLAYNKVAPAVQIEQITADGKTYDAASYEKGGMRLPPLVRNLEIDYTALSLAVPEKVRFRYKLEGRDRDWQEAGNRRQAFYGELPPRRYRFRVAACNNSGVWNEEGAALDFAIAPAYYQANWFRALCVAAFMALLWAVYQLRLRKLAREFNMRLDERVSERTRIARELHDTLLQSFHGVLLLFQAVANELQPGKAKQRLENAIDRAAEAITEGRDAVTGLRASTVERNDLADAMKTLGEGLAAGQTNPNPIGFCVAVEGTSRDLRPILRDEVYRIAVEAVRNAFRHADAKKIEVEIHYDDRRLRVRVRDDGKGIDPKLLGVDGRERHFGLLSMRERAKLIGGKLTVWSELEAGTEVELSIPAERAYTASTEGPRSWFAKKISRKQS